ncbi:MAG: exodeoxyribonuclease V subunit alpha [Brevinematales bacterium]|nr:exodeoxyribonuclease V subunit alpha [Brevinematales bacterium]
MHNIINTSLFKKVMEEYDLPMVYFYSIKDIMEIYGKKDDSLLIILLAMFIYLHNGSICIKNNMNLKNLLSNFGIENPEKVIEEFFKNLEKYSKIIGEPGEYKPLIYVKEKKSLYFEKYYINEKQVNEILQVRRKGKDPSKEVDQIKSYVNSIPNLHQFQRAAVFLSLIKPFLIISGGPGTGKTTIIKHIIDYLIKNKILNEKEIAIATPTGKAAQRIKEIIAEYSIETSTIHRLLKYNYSTNSFYYNSDNKLPYKFIILDEVSMVDIILLRHFLLAITEECNLIMIGDKDQLPSVEAGTFIARIIPENYENSFSSLLKGIVDEKHIVPNSSDSIVLLTQSFRSEKNILSFANIVNQGKKDFSIPEMANNEIQDFMNKNDFIAYYDYKNPLTFKKLYITLLSFQFKKEYFNIFEAFKKIESKEVEKEIDLIKDIFKNVESFKILTLTNVGFFGCDRINEEFAEYLKNKLNKKNYLFSGIPIIINKNDYNLNIFNGNVGVIAEFKDGLKTIFLSKEVKIISPDILPDFSLAFSITVHKSQGSEYDRVIVAIPQETKSSILSRQILYTGITRAKKAVLIAGNKEQIVKSINNSIERESNIE